MRPKAFRPVLLASLLLATPAAVPPAAAADTCVSVTGVAVLPAGELRYWPSLTEQPEPHEVRIVPSGAAEVVLTCVRGGGAATFAGTLTFAAGGASGASIGLEDVTNGAGWAGGLTATGSGVSTLGTTGHGTYGLAATATATVSYAYVRAGVTLALVTTLNGLVVDADGAGGIPGTAWGDVPLATAAPLVIEPAYVLSDYIYGCGICIHDYYVPASAAVAAGT